MPSSPPLGVNVFTAPEKAVVGERPRPFGPPLGWDPITSTLIFGERDAVLVDALTTVAEASALAGWVALHHRNLTTIYVTHGHFDHYFGLAVLLARFPQARAIRHTEIGAVYARTWRQLAALLPAMLAGTTAGGDRRGRAL
jgi:glyoxylase-like metal-dependent hydrolase (beta-lactamase superfamily II)